MLTDPYSPNISAKRKFSAKFNNQGSLKIPADILKQESEKGRNLSSNFDIKATPPLLFNNHEKRYNKAKFDEKTKSDSDPN